jgi:hypothetical protein
MEEKNMASSIINGTQSITSLLDRLLVRQPLGSMRIACFIRSLVVMGFAALFLAACAREDTHGDVPGLSPIPADHYSWDETGLGSIAQGVEMAQGANTPEANACDTKLLEDPISMRMAANDIYDRHIGYGGSDPNLTKIKTALEQRLSKRGEIVAALEEKLRKSSDKTDVLALFSEERRRAFDQYCNGAPKAPRMDSGLTYLEISGVVEFIPEDESCSRAKAAPIAPPPPPPTPASKTNGNDKVRNPAPPVVVTITPTPPEKAPEKAPNLCDSSNPNPPRRCKEGI